MEIRITRSATKHRVSRRSIIGVVLSTDRWLEVAVPPESRSTARRWICVGQDESGREIEVVVIREAAGQRLVAIHAMELRAKTLRLFENE